MSLFQEYARLSEQVLSINIDCLICFLRLARLLTYKQNSSFVIIYNKKVLPLEPKFGQENMIAFYLMTFAIIYNKKVLPLKAKFG